MIKVYVQPGELENCFLLSPSKSKLQRRNRRQKEGASHQGQHSNFLQYNLFTLTCTAKVHDPNKNISGYGLDSTTCYRYGGLHKPPVGGNKRSSQLNSVSLAGNASQGNKKRPHYFRNRAVMSFEKSKLVTAFFR
jgi:hypothetical protein